MQSMVTTGEWSGTAVAIIPARKGSKRLPGKNLQVIAGRTLLCRAIRTVEAAAVPKIVVTTDCDQIAKEAKRCGATVVERPEELATPEASMWDAIRHAFAQHPADLLAAVQCTAPLLTVDDVRRCLLTAERFGRCGCVTQTNSWCVDDRMMPHRMDLLAAGSCFGLQARELEGYEATKHGYKIPVISEIPYHCDIDRREDLEFARFVIEGRGGWMPYPWDIDSTRDAIGCV